LYFLNIMSLRLRYIQNWPELALEANWRAATLAKQQGVSLRTLERYFLKQKGKSPKAWLLEQRRQKADKLLQAGLSVKEAAARLDYKHSTHLSRDYKEHLGCCPTSKTAPIRAQNR
jgi:AraC-like DNA-binding protein